MRKLLLSPSSSDLALLYKQELQVENKTLNSLFIEMSKKEKMNRVEITVAPFAQKSREHQS